MYFYWGIHLQPQNVHAFIIQVFQDSDNKVCQEKG